jgi:aspartyl-tRNA(Asn)/glutamyl-tRNA(Gln) amidotransferase subunit A
MSIDIAKMDIEMLHQGYRSGDFSVQDIVDLYIKNIKEKNDEINAYVEIFEDTLDTQVKKAADMIQSGNIQPLTGVPIAIKDNMLMKGREANAAANILRGHIATYDSDVVKNLKEQGAVILGRANMDDAAMGSSTETSCHGPTKNPLDIARVPGGSSGGSAAAVAMDGALVSLGSDTGGSIRQPAAFCGLVGLKPTYGSISRSGLIALASSLDIIGPMGKSVADVEVVFKSLSRHDDLDSTSIPEELRKEISHSLKKKIGVPRDFLKMEGIGAEVLEDFEASLQRLKKAGYEIVDVDLPLAQYALAVYYILQPAEASSNLARYDGVRYGLSEKGKDLIDSYVKTREAGFGKEVKRRILLGTYVLSHGYYDAYYNKALALQKKIREDFAKVFEKVDVIATPTAPSGAFKLGEKIQDPLAMYMSDIFTVPANIAGIPAISIPSGKDKNNMPLGLHLNAPYLGEDLLFTVGKDFENNK